MDIYDKLLAGIGVGIALTVTGFLALPPIGIVASLASLGLVGASMFVFVPHDTGTPQ